MSFGTDILRTSPTNPSCMYFVMLSKCSYTYIRSCRFGSIVSGGTFLLQTHVTALWQNLQPTPITPSSRRASISPCFNISSTLPVAEKSILSLPTRTRSHVSIVASWITRLTLHPFAGATRRPEKSRGEWMVCFTLDSHPLERLKGVAAFRGELTSHHPHFHPASPAAAKDIDIETAKQLLPDALTVGIHMGSSFCFSIVTPIIKDPFPSGTWHRFDCSLMPRDSWFYFLGPPNVSMPAKFMKTSITPRKTTGPSTTGSQVCVQYICISNTNVN